MTSNSFKIIEAAQGDGIGYQPYGAVLEFWKARDNETIISGAAETGKTRGILEWLDAIAWKYPNAKLAIVRKTYKSLHNSVLQTFEDKVLGAMNPTTHEFDSSLTPVTKYGGARPDWYEYPNGTRIFCGGMDNPDKVLSSERDVIYVNQAEELDLNEWETLATRVTGRAGNMPYSRLVGDCNPAGRMHWIRQRAAAGKLKLLHSRHEDNPTLFNPDTGEITEQGKRTLAILDNLTGVRYLRLRKGIWATAEGIVYTDYDPSLHLLNAAQMQEHGIFKHGTHDIDWMNIRQSIAAVDWGYAHAGVISVLLVDADRRVYVVHQIYQTKRLLDWWVSKALEVRGRFKIQAFICDPAEPAFIERFRRAGLNAKPAFNGVLSGINAVAERFKGRSLFIYADSLEEVDSALQLERKPLRIEDELELYSWANNKTKEQPRKEDDHGLDTVRYGIAEIDGLSNEKRHARGVLVHTKRKGW